MLPTTLKVLLLGEIVLVIGICESPYGYPSWVIAVMRFSIDDVGWVK